MTDPATRLRSAADALARTEPAIQAWAWVDRNAASADAAPTEGPLSGVPFGVKDIIDVAGWPTCCGASFYDPQLARFDASCVALLRRAGAIPIGKTVTAEFAYAHPGPTRNPWNLAHTPGGSSSGSAAAVAAGVVPFGLGTQTGGSIIRPAAYCGVVGLKPTRGRVHRGGVKLLSDTLDTIGWFARSIADTTAVARVLLPWRENDVATPHAPRIALVVADALGTIEPDARAVLLRAADDLRHAAITVDIVDISEAMIALARLHRIIMTHEMARGLAAEWQAHEAELSDALRAALRHGASVTPDEYVAALVATRQHEAWLLARLRDHDAILTPSAAGAAPHGLTSTGESTFNRVWTLLGWPALHLPTGVSANGLPLGVQLVGKPDGDADLLTVGARVHPVLDHRGRTMPDGAGITPS